MKFSDHLEANQKTYWDEEYEWAKVSREKMLNKLTRWMDSEGFLPRLNQTLEHVAITGKVLDLGAGSLWATAELSKLPGVTEISAVDVSENRLRYEGIPFFEKLNGQAEKVKLFVGDAHKMDFPDNHFDVVFCDAVLHHLDNMKYGLKEINRILRPGGYLVALREPILAKYRSSQKLIPKDPRHMQIMNIQYLRFKNQYEYEFILNGFEVVKSLGFNNTRKIRGIPIPAIFGKPPFGKILNLVLCGTETFVLQKIRDTDGNVPTGKQLN
ncbi:MAG: class I SAM-dependent methyltransferase [Proteobacteria bacterium]|nr:MAG: class I SAM-dependent methyltransferase [Pseudomonadota bacterium]